jgi:hypothetical protein
MKGLFRLSRNDACEDLDEIMGRLTRPGMTAPAAQTAAAESKKRKELKKERMAAEGISEQSKKSRIKLKISAELQAAGALEVIIIQSPTTINIIVALCMRAAPRGSDSKYLCDIRIDGRSSNASRIRTGTWPCT